MHQNPNIKVYLKSLEKSNIQDAEDIIRELQRIEDVEEDDATDLYIELLYERYRDMTNKNQHPNSQDGAVIISPALDALDLTKSQDPANSEFNEGLYTHENFGYKSYRQELWQKPVREEYGISNYLSDAKLTFPMTKKEFDVILHTTKNVRQHGNQLEILLKLRHGDEDPTFDFLNTDSSLNALFVALKELPEDAFWNVFLGKDKPVAEENSGRLPGDDCDADQVPLIGAQQLLASMYEDEGELNSAEGTEEDNSIDISSRIPRSEPPSGSSECVQDAQGGKASDALDASERSPFTVDEEPVPALEEESKVPTPAAGEAKEEEEPEDDLLDEDVDEDKFWGAAHKRRKYFLLTQLRLSRLNRARELRGHFSAALPQSTETEPPPLVPLPLKVSEDEIQETQRDSRSPSSSSTSSSSGGSMRRRRARERAQSSGSRSGSESSGDPSAKRPRRSRSTSRSEEEDTKKLNISQERSKSSRGGEMERGRSESSSSCNSDSGGRKEKRDRSRERDISILLPSKDRDSETERERDSLRSSPSRSGFTSALWRLSNRYAQSLLNGVDFQQVTKPLTVKSDNSFLGLGLSFQEKVHRVLKEIV